MTPNGTLERSEFYFCQTEAHTFLVCLFLVMDTRSVETTIVSIQNTQNLSCKQINVSAAAQLYNSNDTDASISFQSNPATLQYYLSLPIDCLRLKRNLIIFNNNSLYIHDL